MVATQEPITTAPTEIVREKKEEPEICHLGRPLGDCPLRAKGCSSFYDVMLHMHPPLDLVSKLLRSSDTPAAWREWATRINGLLDEPRPAWRRWR